jgi:hypothetical protein
MISAVYSNFANDFLSLNRDVNVPKESNKKNKLGKKNYFLLASWKPLTKKSMLRYRTTTSRIRNAGFDF